MARKGIDMSDAFKEYESKGKIGHDEVVDVHGFVSLPEYLVAQMLLAVTYHPAEECKEQIIKDVGKYATDGLRKRISNTLGVIKRLGN